MLLPPVYIKALLLFFGGGGGGLFVGCFVVFEMFFLGGGLDVCGFWDMLFAGLDYL